ncbi:MAG: polysaccharide deacetylase family protein [Pseudomonadota bacterium]
MLSDWSPLRAELAAFRRDNLPLPLWWRDDDAVAPSAALDQLTDLSCTVGLPVHLAIIPAHATDALVARVDGTQLIPVVHGWAHQDHSGPDKKKNEFLSPRAGRRTEITQALDRMRTLFGPKLRAMFVPPWNRIDPSVLPDLPAQGYVAVSTFGPRAHKDPAPGLQQINTHIDPIWWKGTRNLIDPDQLISQTVTVLRARRRNEADAAEPMGLLTHHLVHTPAIWAFSEIFLHEMLSGGATPWTLETP